MKQVGEIINAGQCIRMLDSHHLPSFFHRSSVHLLGRLKDLLILMHQYRHQRKFKGAEEMNRRAMKKREKVLGVEHPDTLTSVYNLTYLFQIHRRRAEASVICLKASKGLWEALSPDHPTTRTCSPSYM